MALPLTDNQSVHLAPQHGPDENVRRLPAKLHSTSRLTLGQYIRRRNGVPAGAPGSLRNMLKRSLGARSFATFWRYWNPIFGYFLGRYSYAPLRRVFPRPLSLLLTFMLCGGVHDLVTSVVRGSATSFFTLWFILFAAGVAAGDAVRMDLSRLSWLFRAVVNLSYIVTCLLGTLAIRALLRLP